jgi:acylglycerol lipase
MLHNENTWKTKDGVDIFAQDWRPDGEIKGVVCLIHGLGEHSGRYQHVAQNFTRAGYAISTMDLRGHGRSGGIRGHFPSYDIVMQDIHQLLNATQTMFPNKPLFLYGHSLGGALVLYFCYTQKRDLHGVIVTAPGVAAGSPIPPLKIFAGKILNSLAPQVTVDNGLDLDCLSSDPKVKQDYLNDRLVHPLISARLGTQLLNIGSWIRNQHGKFPYPLLLMQGADDRIVDPISIEQYAHGLTGDVTFKMWPAMRHEIHNEYDQDLILKTMVDWMDQR